jgi:TRAP transporter TAXI family solute receptor
MPKSVFNFLWKTASNFALILAFGLAPLTAAAENKSIIISSGGPTGVYYPVSVAMCRLYNVKYSFLGYGCTVETSGGSIDNLRQLRAGKVDFAIVQSDWQAHAKNGTDIFDEVGAHAELRSVFALYTESFTVVARANSGIDNFEDLLGKRVNIGNPGSGQRATMEVLMGQYGWNRFDFASTREFASDLQAQALCDNEVDAIVFMAGHPSGTIKTATGTCDTELVNIAGSEIDNLLETSEHYRASTIPAGTYFGQSEDIGTFGVSATMVTTSEQPDESVLRLAQVVFEKLDRLRRLHTALSHLDAAEMQMDIMPASIHDAASSFYSATVN